jgi:uncharacterized protein YlxW (UPF0749 family)
VVNRKDLIIIAMAAFCLTVTLFLMKPTTGQTGTSDETALLLELQSRVDTLNSSVLMQAQELSMRIVDLTAKIGTLQSEVATLQSRVDALESGTPQKEEKNPMSQWIEFLWSLVPNSNAIAKPRPIP